MLRKLSRIILYSFAVLGLIYTILMNLAFEQTMMALNDALYFLFQFNIIDYFGGEVTAGTPSSVDYFFSYIFFPVGTVVSTIITFVGLFVYARNRSIITGYALFIFSALPKENSKWGKIYDLKSRQGINFAVIRLFKDDKFVSQTIADIYGRYRLALPHLTDRNSALGYECEITAENYEPIRVPLKDILSKDLNELNIDIALTSDSQVKIAKSTEFRNKFYYQLGYVINANGIYNLIAATIYTIIYPGTIYGPITLVIYTIVAIWNFWVLRSSKSFLISRALDFDSNEPVVNVLVNLVTETDKVDNLSTSENGVIEFTFQKPGGYILKAYKDGYTWVNKKGESIGEQISVKLTQKGYLDQNLYFKKTISGSSSSQLINPFQ